MNDPDRTVFARRDPANAQAVLIDVPRYLLRAMGNYQPATMDPHAHRPYGYSVFRLDLDSWESFTRFAHYQGWTLTDGRAVPEVHRTQPIECGNIVHSIVDPVTGEILGGEHCGQPVSSGNPPTYCPACGLRFKPRTQEDAVGGHAEAVGGRACVTCGTVNRGRFAYCSHCGTPLPDPPPATVPMVIRRRHLDEPISLADQMQEMVMHRTFPPPTSDG